MLILVASIATGRVMLLPGGYIARRWKDKLRYAIITISRFSLLKADAALGPLLAEGR